MKEFVFTHRTSAFYLKDKVYKQETDRCFSQQISAELKKRTGVGNYQVTSKEVITSGDPDGWGRPLEKHNEVCIVIKGTFEEKINANDTASE